MEHIRTVSLSIVATATALLLGGCGAGSRLQHSDIRESLLLNPAILEKSDSDFSLYSYDKPRANIRKYNKVMIDAVIVSKAGELDAETAENYQKLANNAYIYLTEELKKDYQLVLNPEPYTMKVQLAIIEADAAKAVKSIFFTIMPTGLGMSTEKFSAVDKPVATGKLTGEFKFTDAASGELLGAAIEKNTDNQAIPGSWDNWNNADEALKYWAKRARFVMCEKRIGPFCEKL